MQVQQPDGTVQAVLGQYVDPVLLQVVCYSLWQHLPVEYGVPITFADVAAAGGTDAILQRYLTEAIARAAARTNILESDIRAWITRELITPDGRRSQVLQDDGATVAGLPKATVEQLVYSSLLRAEARRGATWYELAHDALVGPLLAEASSGAEPPTTKSEGTKQAPPATVDPVKLRQAIVRSFSRDELKTLCFDLEPSL